MNIRLVMSLPYAIVLLAGCATYMDAKRNTAPDGQMSRDIAASRAELQASKNQRQSLEDQKRQRERELQQDEARIRALELDLRRQDEALAAALKAKRVSQERYTQLKRESDSIRAEAQQIDMQNKSAAFGASDQKADAAKEARLRELESRRKALEAALAQMAKS